MNKTIEMDGTTYDFTYEDLVWSITFPKSKTRAKELAQLTRTIRKTCDTFYSCKNLK